RDHYELYGLVYGFAAHRALERCGEEMLGRLREIVRRLPDLVDDPSRFGDAARSFHAAVVDGARSPRLAVVLRSMSNLVPGDFFALVPGSVDAARAGLPSILDALEDGDAESASDRYVEMMSRIGDLVVDLFEARGLFSP